jgi:hypothetical protein
MQEGKQVWQVTENDMIELKLDRIKDKDKANKFKSALLG